MRSKLYDMPDDRAAEGAVIGSMIVGPDCISHVVEIVGKDDFTQPGAQRLYEAVLNLWRRGAAIDAVTVRGEAGIGSVDGSEQTMLFDYLVSAITSVPSAASAAYYAQQVYRKSIERKLIGIVAEASQSVESNLSVEEKLAALSSALSALPDFTAEQTDMGTLVAKWLRQLDDEGGLTTSFPSLDRITNGLKKDELILIAGRPSMGKSSLMLDMFIHAARIGAKPFLYSLEMTADKIIVRMLRNIARHKHCYFNRHDPAIAEALNALVRWPAWISQQIDFNVDGLCRQIMAEVKRHGIGICFIDYLQLLQGAGKSRYEQVTQISRELKKTASIAKIPIVVASQLNRACELRTNHRPIMSDLRDSGGIEQDADLILFLHRDDYYRQKTNRNAPLDGLANCIIAKNREGPTGEIDLVWMPECFSFGECVQENTAQQYPLERGAPLSGEEIPF
jgi:replicative DNA helicase